MTTKQAVVGLGLAAALVAGSLAAQNHVLESGAMTAVAPEVASAAFDELFEQSRASKKGLTLYVDGQAIPGIVTRTIGTDAVELRNQEFPRLIVRRDQISAVALH